MIRLMLWIVFCSVVGVLVAALLQGCTPYEFLSCF